MTYEWKGRREEERQRHDEDRVIKGAEIIMDRGGEQQQKSERNSWSSCEKEKSTGETD